MQNALTKSRQLIRRRDHSTCGGLSRIALPSFSDFRPTPDQLRQLLNVRHARAEFFGAHLFGNPAWDILLLGYLALLEDERLTLSDLCQSSIVPATTTLRWVRVLEQDGLLRQHHDVVNPSRSWFELSAAGKVRMERFLTFVAPMLPS